MWDINTSEVWALFNKMLITEFIQTMRSACLITPIMSLFNALPSFVPYLWFTRKVSSLWLEVFKGRSLYIIVPDCGRFRVYIYLLLPPGLVYFVLCVRDNLESTYSLLNWYLMSSMMMAIVQEMKTIEEHTGWCCNFVNFTHAHQLFRDNCSFSDICIHHIHSILCSSYIFISSDRSSCIDSVLL